MTIARWGWPNILATILLCAWIVVLMPCGISQIIASVFSLLVIGYVFWFFRNPIPVIPEAVNVMVSPATGTIADIEEVEEEHFIKGKAIRIGIFLSVFDVHVNRMPFDAQIDYVHYKPGKFLDARHPDATHHNEANTLGLTTTGSEFPGIKLLLRQISGLIARRIICAYGAGESLERGGLYGMIKFGSRTELFIPVDQAHELCVAIGDRVSCGETPLIKLK